VFDASTSPDGAAPVKQLALARLRLGFELRTPIAESLSGLCSASQYCR
jgi:hypothetical protein